MRLPSEVETNGATSPSCPWDSSPVVDESVEFDG